MSGDASACVKGRRSWLRVRRGRDQPRLAKLPKEDCADPAHVLRGKLQSCSAPPAAVSTFSAT